PLLRGSRDDAAGDPLAAAAERLGRVGVVVAAGVDHEGVPLHVGDLEPRDVQLPLGHALVGDLQLGQVPLVTTAAGALVRLGGVGIEVAARGLAGGLLAVLVGGIAAR